VPLRVVVPVTVTCAAGQVNDAGVCRWRWGEAHRHERAAVDVQGGVFELARSEPAHAGVVH